MLLIIQLLSLLQYMKSIQRFSQVGRFPITLQCTSCVYTNYLHVSQTISRVCSCRVVYVLVC